MTSSTSPEIFAYPIITSVFVCIIVFVDARMGLGVELGAEGLVCVAIGVFEGLGVIVAVNVVVGTLCGGKIAALALQNKIIINIIANRKTSSHSLN